MVFMYILDRGSQQSINIGQALPCPVKFSPAPMQARNVNNIQDLYRQHRNRTGASVKEGVGRYAHPAGVLLRGIHLGDPCLLHP